MTTIPYRAPELNETSFNCPFCNAFAKQNWSWLVVGNMRSTLDDCTVCFCSHCDKYSIWHDDIMIYPNFSGIEPPNQDLSEEIQSDYQEAAEILQRSPRGAAALLRLALQKLCVQLGEKGVDLNTDIGNLVTKGLPTKVKESLDAVRVIGNEAVHPGQMDLKDDANTATSLFRLINFIAEKLITEPKEVDEIYNKLPETKKQQITLRDAKT